MSENENGIPLTAYFDEPVRRKVGDGSFLQHGRMLFQIHKSDDYTYARSVLNTSRCSSGEMVKNSDIRDKADMTRNELSRMGMFCVHDTIPWLLLTLKQAEKLFYANIYGLDDIPQFGTPLSEIFAEPEELPVIGLGTCLYDEKLNMMFILSKVDDDKIGLPSVNGHRYNPPVFDDNNPLLSLKNLIAEKYIKDFYVLTPAQAAAKFTEIVGAGK